MTWWRPIERLGGFLTRSVRRKKLILLPLIFAALVLLVLLGSFEKVLRDLHEVGGERWSTASLANDLFAGWDAAHFAEILDTWRTVADEADAESSRVLAFYAVADILFALVYTVLVGMLLVMLKRGLGAAAPPGELEQPKPYRRAVDIALFSLGILFVADVLENLLIYRASSVDPADVPGGLVELLWVVFRVKLLFTTLVLVPGIVAAVSFLVQRPTVRKPVFAALAVVRGQLIVLGVLLAGLFVSDQAVDALRRWYEDEWDGIFAVSMLVCLAFFVVVSTDWILVAAARPRARSDSVVRLVVSGLLAGGVALLAALRFDGWIGLATLGGLLVVIGVLSWLIPGVPSDGSGRDVESARGWLPLTLGLLILFLPILALVGAIAAPVALGQFEFLWLCQWIALLAGFGVALFFTYKWLGRITESRRGRRIVIWVTVVLLAAVFFRIVHNPWRTADAFGTVAFLAAFLLGLSLVLFLLLRRAEEVRPADIFTLVRLRCTPVILLVVVWMAVTSMVDPQTTYHDVRELEATPAARAAHTVISPQEAFRRWKERKKPSGEARPMLFVAAAGGGIRAAYWTATVLSCVLQGQGPPGVCDAAGTRADDRGVESLFAASGISGGSLGLASYFAHLTDDPDPGWQEKRLLDDYASPLVAWGLFVDFPSALFRRTGGSDRADILERAFERSWIDDLPDGTKQRVLWGGAPSTDKSRLASGLFDSYESQTRDAPLPILMLSGTKVQEGCRLNVSVLNTSVEPPEQRKKQKTKGETEAEDGEAEATVEDCLSLRLFEEPEQGTQDEERKDTPATPDDATRSTWSLSSSDDLLTYLCPRDPEEMNRAEPEEDVRLSTAVMLSARFPFALPSGRLTRCGEEDLAPANVVDGGYFDTSGASPLVELWGALARVVSVANRQHENGTRPDRPPAACIVPYFLQIDTGYADPVKRGDLSPAELLVPPVAALRARDARENNARQAAALLFSGPPETGPKASRRYAHIYPRAHPGIRAPLGWTLSDAAREELEGQLGDNRAEIAKVRRWLADKQTCS